MEEMIVSFIVAAPRGVLSVYVGQVRRRNQGKVLWYQRDILTRLIQGYIH